MRKLVFTIKDDICAKNNKPVDAVELIKVMNSYGLVEEYDNVLRVEKAEYQKTIDSLNAQLLAIKDQNLTTDEMNLVSAYRVCKAENERKLKAENDILARKLTSTTELFQSTMGKIKDIVGTEITG